MTWKSPFSVWSGGLGTAPCPARLRSGDQIVASALRIRGVLEDRTLVRPKNAQPVVEIGGIHLERMGREAERLTQKHRGQFRDDLLACVRGVAELREPEITVQSMGGFRGMSQLMGPDPVEVPWVLEPL